MTRHPPAIWAERIIRNLPFTCDRCGVATECGDPVELVIDPVQKHGTWWLCDTCAYALGKQLISRVVEPRIAWPTGARLNLEEPEPVSLQEMIAEGEPTLPLMATDTATPADRVEAVLDQLTLRCGWCFALLEQVRVAVESSGRLTDQGVRLRCPNHPQVIYVFPAPEDV